MEQEEEVILLTLTTEAMPNMEEEVVRLEAILMVVLVQYQKAVHLYLAQEGVVEATVMEEKQEVLPLLLVEHGVHIL